MELINALLGVAGDLLSTIGTLLSGVLPGGVPSLPPLPDIPLPPVVPPPPLLP